MGALIVSQCSAVQGGASEPNASLARLCPSARIEQQPRLHVSWYRVEGMIIQAQAAVWVQLSPQYIVRRVGCNNHRIQIQSSVENGDGVFTMIAPIELHSRKPS